MVAIVLFLWFVYLFIYLFLFRVLYIKDICFTFQVPVPGANGVHAVAAVAVEFNRGGDYVREVRHAQMKKDNREHATCFLV